MKTKTKSLPYGNVNIDLFQKIKAKILTYPQQFDMSDWNYPLRGVGGTDCGTVCCISGWVMGIARAEGLTKNEGKSYDDEENLLNIPPGIDCIFLASRWPEPFYTQYIQAYTRQKESEVAARFIDYICGIRP